MNEDEILHGLARLPDGRRKQNLLDSWETVKAELLPGRIWPFSSEAAHGYGALVSYRDRLGLPIATAEAQITAKVPVLKGGALVIPVGLLLALHGHAEPEGVDAAARKRVELLAMNAVFEAEKVLGRMPKDVSAERGRGYDIESIDAAGNLFFIEVKGRADRSDSVTLTINEVNVGRNAPSASAWRW